MTKLTTELLPDGSAELMGAFLAADYYDGMYSALYAVASTGSLELRDGDGLGRLITELREAAAIADGLGRFDEHEQLTAFLQWAVNFDQTTERK